MPVSSGWGHWLGVFATTVLCLFAANIAFGVVCTATFFIALPDRGSSQTIAGVGLTVAGLVWLATLILLVRAVVLPRWRRSRRTVSPPPS